jgi:hypothetical protein
VPDAGVDGGPLALCTIPLPKEADGPEPGLSTSCDGVLADGTQSTGAVDYSLGTMGSSCVGETSDGAGTVAILLSSSSNSSRQPYAEFIDADGGVRRDETAESLAPQPSGFAILGAHLDIDFRPFDEFFHFSFSNDPPPLVNDSGIFVATAPGGGALAATFTWNLDRWFISAVRFDDGGHAVSPISDLVDGPAQPGSSNFAVAVATGGDGIVAFSGNILGDANSVYGIWVRRDGSSDRTPIRLTQTAPRRMLLRPLADGSIALRADGAWVARALPSGEVRPPPAWLVALADHDLLLRTSGSGYVVPAPGVAQGGSCAPLLQLRAPAGNLCGLLGVRNRIAAAAELGLDGTLFATFFGAPCDFGLCCHVRWWKGALP